MRCTACDEHMKAGDEYLPEAQGGVIHFACCGPERECFTKGDGAHTFAKRRLVKIEELLEEIAYVYDGVDQSIDMRCTEARDGDIARIREAIDYALETDAQP